MDKAHILEEIKRITRESGGIPLGRQKLESETGIKSYHWKKFWPQWTSAVGEAGFSPNQFDNSYGENELLEMYAKFAQELAKLPAQSDLVFKDTTMLHFQRPQHSTASAEKPV